MRRISVNKFHLKGGEDLTEIKVNEVRTKRKIGKVTYTICSSSSQGATDTLEKKIKDCIRRDMENNAQNGKKLDKKWQEQRYMV